MENSILGWKTCHYKECKKRFHRRKGESIYHWKKKIFCSRLCQARNSGATGKKSMASFHDALDSKYYQTRGRLSKKVKIYKGLSQEDFLKLVPSAQPDYYRKESDGLTSGKRRTRKVKCNSSW